MEEKRANALKRERPRKKKRVPTLMPTGADKNRLPKRFLGREKHSRTAAYDKTAKTPKDHTGKRSMR